MAHLAHSIRQYLPPSARWLVNRVLGGLLRYEGPYENWQASRSNSTGYDDSDILARVTDATLRVLHGDAEYEQDGRAFSEPTPPSHALAGLMLAAAFDGGKLSVVDLGGGLGSHFLRWRRQLEALPEARWCVVEQAHYVDEGTKLLQCVPSLSFITSIEQARDFMPNAALASSVLQYLPEPLAMLDSLMSLHPKLIIIDRTPFSCDDTPYILTQHVPKSLGGASYPLWSLSRSAIHTALERDFRLMWEFPSADTPITRRHLRANYAGSVWLRND